MLTHKLELKIENFAIPRFSIDEKTKEDIAKVNSFVKELKREGVPLERVTEIKGKKVLVPGTYNSSMIRSYTNSETCNKIFGYGDSSRFIGRMFNLLFGSGFLEYDCSREQFYFDFSYKSSNRLEQEILLRLKLSNVKESWNDVLYATPIDNADLNKIKKAYEEIKSVNRKLKLTSTLSGILDSVLKRR
ncbi:MAG: hypothetical protein Q8R00_00150 [Candidatus Nanoarchaeia archaeon]|nr:hypothetical protein [Candidatus Nanoarchaeia archaeon]